MHHVELHIIKIVQLLKIKQKVAPKAPKERRNPEAERTRLVIDEKRLEIRKELIKETPDWKKIERINTEIATEQAKERTVNMKSRFEARKNIEQQLQKNN